MVTFNLSLANKDDLCVDFFPYTHLPNLMLVLSITSKLYFFDIAKNQLIIELDTGHKLNAESFSCAFASLNQSLFVKAQATDKSITSMLECYSLRLVPQLEDYFVYSKNAQFYENFLPNRSSLNDRIKILMEKRIDEQSSRKDRLKKMWSEVQSHRNI